LFLLPGLALLPVWMGVDGVWTSMPVSDFLATVAAVVMFVYQIRKFRREANNATL
jgi:Na+-driven multidrug efflux pump